MSASLYEWAEGQTEFNLTNAVSRSPYTACDAKITYLKLLDKDYALYRIGEHLRMKLRIHTNKEFRDLRLRLELRYSDDTPVGTMPMVSLGHLDAGQDTEFLVDFDTSTLPNGKFRVDTVLFEIDDVGNSYDEELLLPAFFFEVQDSEDIVWNQTTWGHVRFPEAKVERIG